MFVHQLHTPDAERGQIENILAELERCSRALAERGGGVESLRIDQPIWAVSEFSHNQVTLRAQRDEAVSQPARAVENRARLLFARRGLDMDKMSADTSRLGRIMKTVPGRVDRRMHPPAKLCPDDEQTIEASLLRMQEKAASSALQLQVERNQCTFDAFRVGSVSMSSKQGRELVSVLHGSHSFVRDAVAVESTEPLSGQGRSGRLNISPRAEAYAVAIRRVYGGGGGPNMSFPLVNELAVAAKKVEGESSSRFGKVTPLWAILQRMLANSKAALLTDKPHVQKKERVPSMSEVAAGASELHVGYLDGRAETPPIQIAFNNGARHYLESQYVKHVKKEIAKAPVVASLGGEPGPRSLIRAYLNMKIQDHVLTSENSSSLLTFREHEDWIRWAMIFYSLRCGFLHSALEDSEHVGGPGNVGELSFSSILGTFLENGFLPPSILSNVADELHKLLYSQDQYRRRQDAYRLVVYAIVCGNRQLSYSVYKAEGVKDVVLEHRESWLWYQLYLVRAVKDRNADAALYSVHNLQSDVDSVPQKFRNPLVLLCGQKFRDTIEALASTNEVDALHFGLCLNWYGMIDLGGKEGDILNNNALRQKNHTSEFLGMRHLLTCYVDTLGEVSPMLALDYSCLPLAGRGDVDPPHDLVVRLFCGRREFSEFKSMFKYLEGIIPDSDTRYQIVLEAAEICSGMCRNADAVSLYVLAGRSDRALSIGNDMFSRALIGAGRLTVSQLPLSHEGQIDLPGSLDVFDAVQKSRVYVDQVASLIGESRGFRIGGCRADDALDQAAINGADSTTFVDIEPELKALRLLRRVQNAFTCFRESKFEEALRGVDSLEPRIIPLRVDQVEFCISVMQKLHPSLVQLIPLLLLVVVNAVSEILRACRERASCDPTYGNSRDYVEDKKQIRLRIDAVQQFSAKTTRMSEYPIDVLIGKLQASLPESAWT